jgi:hypothetical protein
VLPDGIFSNQKYFFPFWYVVPIKTWQPWCTYVGSTRMKLLCTKNEQTHLVFFIIFCASDLISQQEITKAKDD